MKMLHKRIASLWLFGLIIVSLLVSGVAVGKTPSSGPVPDGGYIPSPQASIPTSVGQASADPVLGEPGTSFRYLETIGITGEPYPADMDHLNTPHGLYIDDDDNLFVTEIRACRVVEYAASGTGLLTLGQAGNPWHHDNFLSSPRDTVVDADGNIWVVFTHALKQFDPDGNMLQIFPADDPWQNGSDNGHFADPNGVTIDSAGLLYVADSANHRIQVFDLSSGTPVYMETIGVTGEARSDNTGFDSPQRVAFDSLGQLYVLDENNNRLQRCTKTTEWTCETFFGVTDEYGSDTDHLGWAYGLAIQNDNVYVADTSNVRVLKCDPTGTCVNFAGEPEVGGSDNSHFYWPTDVAVDSTGKVFVADEANHRVQIFNSAGNYLGTRGVTLVPYLTDNIRVNSPWGVAVSNDGGLLVTEHEGHRLIKYDANLKQVWANGIAGVTMGDDAYSHLSGNPAQDSAGRIYFPDTLNHAIVILSADGSYLGVIGVKWEAGDDNAHFDCPRGVAISPVNQDIYVVDSCNQRIQVFDKDRLYKATLGVTDETGTDNLHFDSPYGIALDALGNIYVADTWNYRIQKCTLVGTAYSCTTFAGETGVFDDAFNHFYPQAVAVDHIGNVYVADEWNSRVQVYDKYGAYLTTIGGVWEFNNKGFVNPVGVAVDSSGYVYISDYNNHRVQVFAPSYPGWQQANINGFGTRNNQVIPAMGTFNGYVYASTTDWVNNELTVYRSADGKTWETGDMLFSSGVSALQGFEDHIYAGTWDGNIYSSEDGLVWSLVFSSSDGISHFSVFNDALYAGVYTDASIEGTTIYKTTDGLAWEPFVTNGNGTQTVSGVISSATFNGLHYFGAADWSDATGAHIWRTDGTTLTEVVDDGFGDPLNRAPGSMAVLENYLYVSIGLEDGYEVWRSPSGDYGTWENVLEGDPDEPGVTHYTGMAALGNTLYLILENLETGVKVWTTNNGVDWAISVQDGFGDMNNVRIEWGNSMVIFNNQLYVGFWNAANGAEIWRLLHTTYLPLIVRKQ
jgi:sugar lactone lactonase YvrE